MWPLEIKRTDIIFTLWSVEQLHSTENFLVIVLLYLHDRAVLLTAASIFQVLCRISEAMVVSIVQMFTRVRQKRTPCRPMRYTAAWAAIEVQRAAHVHSWLSWNGLNPIEWGLIAMPICGEAVDSETVLLPMTIPQTCGYGFICHSKQDMRQKVMSKWSWLHMNLGQTTETKHLYPIHSCRLINCILLSFFFAHTSYKCTVCHLVFNYLLQVNTHCSLPNGHKDESLNT